jgi:hypothetical protein
MRSNRYIQYCCYSWTGAGCYNKVRQTLPYFTHHLHTAAFVPFIAFVYPGLKTPRKSVLVSVSLLEILVLVLFLYAILIMPLLPNKSLQATRDGALLLRQGYGGQSSPAIADYVISPACLSSGR